MSEKDNENYTDYFSALDMLVESGTMNMFGAPGWLVENFDVDRKEADAIFQAWTMYFQTKEGV